MNQIYLLLFKESIRDLTNEERMYSEYTMNEIKVLKAMKDGNIVYKFPQMTLVTEAEITIK